MDKEIFKNISYGMYIVSTKLDKPVGCVINTLTQITSDNPIISISLNKENYTNEIIKKTKTFSISILNEDINPSIISKFGFNSSKEVDKFANLDYELINNIPVLKEGSSGYLICEVINIIDAETHDIFIARVKDTKKLNDNTPMTYKYYHEVIKGSSSRKAPTYIEKKNDHEVWECLMCGYIFEGDIPDDFVCPICGATKDSFIKK